MERHSEKIKAESKKNNKHNFHDNGATPKAIGKTAKIIALKEYKKELKNFVGREKQKNKGTKQIKDKKEKEGIIKDKRKQKPLSEDISQIKKLIMRKIFSGSAYNGSGVFNAAGNSTIRAT